MGVGRQPSMNQSHIPGKGTRAPGRVQPGAAGARVLVRLSTGFTHVLTTKRAGTRSSSLGSGSAHNAGHSLSHLPSLLLCGEVSLPWGPAFYGKPWLCPPSADLEQERFGDTLRGDWWGMCQRAQRLAFSAKMGLPESSLRCKNSRWRDPNSARMLLLPSMAQPQLRLEPLKDRSGGRPLSPLAAARPLFRAAVMASGEGAASDRHCISRPCTAGGRHSGALICRGGRRGWWDETIAEL